MVAKDFQGTCMVEFCPQVSTIPMAPMGPLKCCRFLLSKPIISTAQQHKLDGSCLWDQIGINYHSSHSHDSVKLGGGISNISVGTRRQIKTNSPRVGKHRNGVGKA